MSKDYDKSDNLFSHPQIGCISKGLAIHNGYLLVGDFGLKRVCFVIVIVRVII